MNKLFQRWVTARLRRHLQGAFVVEDEPQVALDRRRAVVMAPDLRFRHRDEVVYVGDIKYKLTGSGVAHSHDYYQLLAYTTALGLEEGLLIYCQSEGDVPEREIIVRGGGTRLRSHALDLRGSRKDIEAAIGELARSIEDRCMGATLR